MQDYNIERDDFSITITFANFGWEDGIIVDYDRTITEAEEAVENEVRDAVQQFDRDNGWDSDTFTIVGSANKTVGQIKDTFTGCDITVDVRDDLGSNSTVTIEWSEPEDYWSQGLQDQYIEQLYNQLSKNSIEICCNETAYDVILPHQLRFPEGESDDWEEIWDYAEERGYYYDYALGDFVPIDEADEDQKFRHKHRVLDAKDDDPVKLFAQGREVNVA